MKIKRFICAFLSVSVLALSGCGQTEVKEVDMKTITLSSSQISDVNAKVDKELTDCNFSGSAAITLNTQSVYEKSFGFSNEKKDKKNTNATEYQISSVSSVFTAVAAAMLIDEGKLKKTDTLAVFFKSAASNAGLKDITVEDLLLKNVDFGDYTNSFISATDQLVKYNHLAKNENKKNYETIKNDISAFILNVSKYHRSETPASNYYLLGRIIEKASKTDYKEYVKKNIIDRLGLNHTDFVSQKKKLSGYDTNLGKWRYSDEYPIYSSFGYLYSAYGITSSASDLSKLFSAIINNKLTKINILREAKKSDSNYGYGLSVDGRNLAVKGETYLNSSYVFINPESLECSILLSNSVGKYGIKEVGKDLHGVINSKINGILLENAMGNK